MDTARLFQSGRSQAVRLPKDYRFRGSEVAVKHFGNGVLLLRSTTPGRPWRTDWRRLNRASCWSGSGSSGWGRSV